MARELNAMKPCTAKVTGWPSLEITVEGVTSARKESGSAWAGMETKNEAHTSSDKNVDRQGNVFMVVARTEVLR